MKVAECSILFKFKEGKNNRSNTLSISRIKVLVWRINLTKGHYAQVSQTLTGKPVSGQDIKRIVRGDIGNKKQ